MATAGRSLHLIRRRIVGRVGKPPGRRSDMHQKHRFPVYSAREELTLRGPQVRVYQRGCTALPRRYSPRSLWAPRLQTTGASGRISLWKFSFIAQLRRLVHREGPRPPYVYNAWPGRRKWFRNYTPPPRESLGTPRNQWGQKGRKKKASNEQGTAEA